MSAQPSSEQTSPLFSELGLDPKIVQAVTEQGYTKPSPIQAQAIPAVLNGKDVMAAAQTGTGKTAGFTLPMLERLSKGQRPKANQVRALVLTPTRELAAQVGASVATYSEYMPLNSAIVYGGVKINPQMMRMRRGVDVLVATPGRLLDLYNQNAVKFNQLEMLVLDEADRMLDMGFIHDIRKILALLPAKRQNLMFSATFSPAIRELAKGIVHSPIEISVSPVNSTAQTVKQWVCPVDKKQKAIVLSQLMNQHKWRQILVFTRTKHGANKLTRHLEAEGFQAAAIHGNKSQGARTRALAQFKDGSIQVLVATDIAARGLDINQLPQVVNFDLPNVPEDYVHRIGRTGRAGASGEAVSLVTADEVEQLWAIESLIGEFIVRQPLPGFEPNTPVPESTLKAPKKPKKPKRAKKPKPHQAAKQGEHKDGQRAPSKSSNKGNGKTNPPSPSNHGKKQSKRSENEKSRAPSAAKKGQHKKQNTGKSNTPPGQPRKRPAKSSKTNASSTR